MSSRDGKGIGRGSDRERPRRKKDKNVSSIREGRKAEVSPSPPVVLLKRTESPLASHSEQEFPRLQSSSLEIPHVISKPVAIAARERPKTVLNAGGDSGSASVSPATVCPLDVLNHDFYFHTESSVPLMKDCKPLSPMNVKFIMQNREAKDFFVITVIGAPNSGKSFLLNNLCDENGTKAPFSTRTAKTRNEIHAFGTYEKIIYIEIPPVFSSESAIDLASASHYHTSFLASTVTWNLRLMRWALCISHVVLVVGNQLIEPELFHLIDSAELIHSIESAFGDNVQPELVYVCNNARLGGVPTTERMEKVGAIFSAVTGRSPKISPNVYTVPNKNNATFEIRMQKLRTGLRNYFQNTRAVYNPNSSVEILHADTCMMEWYQTASKIWETMSTTSFFNSYLNLLP